MEQQNSQYECSYYIVQKSFNMKEANSEKSVINTTQLIAQIITLGKNSQSKMFYIYFGRISRWHGNDSKLFYSY